MFEVWINGILKDEYNRYENAKIHAEIAKRLGNNICLVKKDDVIIFEAKN